ncbi:MAG TPA: lytic murein transglycosylase [Jiangellaceae bacterium]
MRLVLRTLGGGVVAACALSLSGAAAIPSTERIVQFVPTVASVTRIAPDGSMRGVSAELTDPMSAEDSVVTAELITDDELLTGDEAATNLAISPSDLNIPELALKAYQRAADEAPGRCGLRWEVLAGIGKIESNHARGGQLNADGDTITPIVGPVLNGAGPIAAIRDSDGGKWDGDAVWDRAVGPMQFIPGTWKRFGTDGNNDGVANPHNMWDSAASAAAYLCAGGADLSTDAGLRSALLRYNRSTAYVNNVIRWINAYAGGEVVAVGSTGGGGSTSSRDGSGTSTTTRDPQPIAKPTSPPSTNSNGSNSSGGSTGGSSTQDPVASPSISPRPPTTDPPATEDPTDPPTTDPPATEDPTDPPATEEPATDPPATEEPATDPPATEEPATDPPTTEPPATEEPSPDPTQSPADECTDAADGTDTGEEPCAGEGFADDGEPVRETDPVTVEEGEGDG